MEPPQRDPLEGLTTPELARLADELLRNPLLQHVLWQLDDAAVTVWRRSTSPGQREDQWHMVVALAAIRTKLMSMIDNARLGQRPGAQQRKQPA